MCRPSNPKSIHASSSSASHAIVKSTCGAAVNSTGGRPPHSRNQYARAPPGQGRRYQIKMGTWTQEKEDALKLAKASGALDRVITRKPRPYRLDQDAPSGVKKPRAAPWTTKPAAPYPPSAPKPKRAPKFERSDSDSSLDLDSNEPLSIVTRSASRVQTHTEPVEEIESDLCKAARVADEFEMGCENQFLFDHELQQPVSYESTLNPQAQFDSPPPYEEGQYLLHQCNQSQCVELSMDDIPSIPLTTTEGIFLTPLQRGWEPNKETANSINDFLQSNVSFLDARNPYQGY